MRIALGIEYQGTGYHGWQIQSTCITIQSCLETALSRVADTPIRVHAAGRTDAGVHACGQVVHFDTEVERSDRAWLWGTNHYLPADIQVRWVAQVDDDFHARFSAQARTYRYLIDNHSIASALWRAHSVWVAAPLAVAAMNEGAAHLLGAHDFSSFRGPHCQSKTPMRCMHALQVRRQGDWVEVDITANAFLHNMVRNILGVLVEVGKGRQDPQWVQEVLAARMRTKAARTFPPQGLYLMRVDYCAPWLFPQNDATLAASCAYSVS